MLKSLMTADSACGMAETRAATGGIEWLSHQRLRTRGWFWGLIAGALLFLAYVGIVSVANSPAHAIGEFLRLWYWMMPMVGGFALQVGLFAYARGAAHATAGLHAGGVVASGGASTISMAACCAHHVTDVLPLVGLAGTGLFLSTYQSLFLLLGVLSNIVGTVYMLSLLGRHHLVPSRGSLLSPIPNLPWRRVLPVSVAISLLILLMAGSAQFF